MILSLLTFFVCILHSFTLPTRCWCFSLRFFFLVLTICLKANALYVFACISVRLRMFHDFRHMCTLNVLHSEMVEWSHTQCMAFVGVPENARHFFFHDASNRSIDRERARPYVYTQLSRVYTYYVECCFLGNRLWIKKKITVSVVWEYMKIKI